MGLVRLAHLADLDLDSIRDYIREHNPRAANNVLDQLFETLELLANQPELGERREDLAEQLRAFVVLPDFLSTGRRWDPRHPHCPWRKRLSSNDSMTSPFRPTRLL